MKKKYLILFMVSLLCTKGNAQENINKDYKYWFNVGLGGQFVLHTSFSVNYNWSLNNYFAQVGYNSNGEVVGAFAKIFDPKPDYEEGYLIQAINFGMGTRNVKRYFSLASFIGPAFIWGEMPKTEERVEGGYEIYRTYKDFHSIGLVAQSQFIFKPIREFGVGIELYGNLNKIRNIACVRVIFHFNNAK